MNKIPCEYSQKKPSFASRRLLRSAGAELLENEAVKEAYLGKKK